MKRLRLDGEYGEAIARVRQEQARFYRGLRRAGHGRLARWLWFDAQRQAKAFAERLFSKGTCESGGLADLFKKPH